MPANFRASLMTQTVTRKLTRQLNQSLREAIATMLAILATFACVLALDPEPGPLVLAVVLTLSLWRSQLDHDWRGRLDAAAVLQLVGLVSLGVGALLLTTQLGTHDAVTVACMLLAVFFGVWLRPLGYAWWALFVTLALALLQSFIGIQAQLILWPRLQEIVIGAVIGVAAAWFVLPVPSIAVLRRRIADALALLSTALDPVTPSPTPFLEDFIAAVASVEQLAPAFRAWRLISGRFITTQPADWIDTLADCATPAVAMINRRAIPPALRAELGKARRALREPAEILPALQALKRVIHHASRE